MRFLTQVNDLTDELKMSLDKLSDTEKELKALARSQSNPQLLPKPSPACEKAAQIEIVSLLHGGQRRMRKNPQGRAAVNPAQERTHDTPLSFVRR